MVIFRNMFKFLSVLLSGFIFISFTNLSMAQEPILNGVFNCNVVESKRWFFNSNTNWNEKDHIQIEQFNVGYGIKRGGYLWLGSLNWEATRTKGVVIDLDRRAYSDTRKLQFNNHNGRVRAQINYFEGEKFLFADKFYFDENYLEVTKQNGTFHLTKVSETEWLGTNVSWWSGAREAQGAVYVTSLSCKHEIDILGELFSYLYDRE